MKSDNEQIILEWAGRAKRDGALVLRAVSKAVSR